MVVFQSGCAIDVNKYTNARVPWVALSFGIVAILGNIFAVRVVCGNKVARNCDSACMYYFTLPVCALMILIFFRILAAADAFDLCKPTISMRLSVPGVLAVVYSIIL